jgi:hypothetical protein
VRFLRVLSDMYFKRRLIARACLSVADHNLAYQL